MGEIKESLKLVALFAHRREGSMSLQLGYAGEAIEAELQKLDEKAGSRFDGLFSTMRDRLRQQDKRIEELAATIGKELRGQDEEIKKLDRWCEGVVTANSRLSKTLDKTEPHILDHQRRVETAVKVCLGKEKDIPTDKDKPFQVRDIIELIGGGLRIVLKVKSEREMELLDVFTGNRWWSSCPSNYTLVYRLGSPKPEPTVKEKVVTDKDGKPEGGLERGDVMSYTVLDKDSPFYEKKILIQFARKETDYQYRYWQNLNSGTRDAFCHNGFISKNRVTFEFRPRFPDQKER